MTPYFLFWLQS